MSKIVVLCKETRCRVVPRKTGRSCPDYWVGNTVIGSRWLPSDPGPWSPVVTGRRSRPVKKPVSLRLLRPQGDRIPTTLLDPRTTTSLFFVRQLLPISSKYSSENQKDTARSVGQTSLPKIVRVGKEASEERWDRVGGGVRGSVQTCRR